MGILQPRKRRILRKGFTIVELLVVVVTIALLASITLVVYRGVQQNARDKTVQSDLDALDALETQYGISNNTSGLAWYSGNPATANTTLGFTPSKGNVIDVVVSANDYCIRGYNKSSNKNSITNAFIEESNPGVCIGLQPSVAAGGTAAGLNSLAAWWKFNGSALDSSDNAINGTVMGATLTTGQKGDPATAYLLGNTAAWINVGSPAQFSALKTSGFTYSVWLMRTGASTYNWPQIMGASNTHIDYGIRSGNFGDGIYGEFGTTPYAGTFLASTSSSLPVNTWHLATMTYDGTILRWYWDGKLVNSVTVALNPAQASFQFSSASNGWAGSIDDARVYKRAISDADVQTLYSLNAQ